MLQIGNTPVHLAVEQGHLKVMEALLDAGADVNAKSKASHTTLAFFERSKYASVRQCCLYFEVAYGQFLAGGRIFCGPPPWSNSQGDPKSWGVLGRSPREKYWGSATDFRGFS
jgi:ankyrin repeat protein